ncbi:hypothetical protein MKX67_18475 [Cytobacillus sp. FSL W7-1323]|uniref:hypothetical protein n=1 Tax=Cytobacillus TaxID=2675230 RepID=UPI0031584525
MINLIGFNGPAPHSVILWRTGGVNTAKTVCYSSDEQNEALSRFHTQGDFYNQYEQAVIVKDDNKILIKNHLISMGA